MMLEAFRRFSGTFAARLLLMALIAAFAAWGIEGFLQGRQETVAVRVADTQVSMLELESAYRLRVRELERLLGSPADPEQLAQLGLAEQVLAEAVTRAVLRDTADALGLQAATRALQADIAAIDAFQNAAGDFDPTRYRTLLAQAGQTPAAFERELAADLKIRQLAQLVRLANLPAEVASPQLKAATATLTLDVATLTPTPVTATPTEAQLAEYYELNPLTYTRPEQRSGQVLILDPAGLAQKLTLPEDRLHTAYEENLAALTEPERRTVRHILVPTQASATALQPTITDLASFAAAADAFSTDPGNRTAAGTGRGGSLGEITRTEVVPAFADMAFTLPVNTLSAPVQTPFGWHLIWVDAITPARVPAFEEVRAQLEADLRLAEATEVVMNLAEQVETRLAGGAELATVAREVGLELQPLPLQTAETALADPLAEALFTLTSPGEVSPAVERQDGSLAYVGLQTLVPAALPPLNEIRAQVVRDWRALQQELQANRAGEALLAAARAEAVGERSLAAAARQAAVSARVETLTFTGLEEAPSWLRARLLELMAATPGTTLNTVLREGDTRRVVRLRERTYAEAPDPALASASLSAELGADLEALVVNHLQQTARIRCNPGALRLVFGRDVACPAGSQ